MSRFDCIAYDKKSCEIQKRFKKLFTDIERTADALPDGRYKSLLFTHLEYAYMCAGKAIRDEQIEGRNCLTSTI